MERTRKFLRRTSSARAEYEPLTGAEVATPLEGSAVLEGAGEVPFSWFEYSIFALLGMAMLWAWNMFLAAAPYFSSRFQGDPWIEANFQSCILAVSTVANLGTMLVLTARQHGASYPFRINLALIANMAVFSLLTASTAVFLSAPPRAYLAFLLAMVAGSAWAAGLVQNGAFAFAASFGRPEYMQALMAGQGVAGVLPAVAQVLTVLLLPPAKDEVETSGRRDGASEPDKGTFSSAFLYFLAAVAMSAVALAAFVPLVRRHDHIVENRMVEQMADSFASIAESERAARKHISPIRLFRKLYLLSTGIALVFATSMFFPVFTAKITSVRNTDSNGSTDIPLLFRSEAFIPLAFFFWNLGDLTGRIATMLPFSLARRPWLLFSLSVARVAMLPLYLLCNIGGRGAVVPSDFFYLFLVQLPFGLTNGWLGSCFMMAAPEWVDEGEREATGGFMGLCLVTGLTLGSLLSFTISGL